MKHTLKCLLPALLLTAVLFTGCAGQADDPDPTTVSLNYDFSNGAHGWESGFAEYTPDMADGMQLESGIRDLPAELETDGTGYYIQGMNASDDLFMFLKKRLNAADGIVAGQEYRVKFTIVFASNAPSNAFGIGGPPGEAVYLKAGASADEPDVYLDTTDGHYRMTVDKDGGNSGSGPAASVTGNIANGLNAEDIDFSNPPYVSLERQHEHEYTVTAGDTGELWLLVGTDSGFEGLTGIYYQSISVTLEPIA